MPRRQPPQAATICGLLCVKQQAGERCPPALIEALRRDQNEQAPLRSRAVLERQRVAKVGTSL